MAFPEIQLALPDDMPYRLQICPASPVITSAPVCAINLSVRIFYWFHFLMKLILILTVVLICYSGWEPRSYSVVVKPKSIKNKITQSQLSSLLSIDLHDCGSLRRKTGFTASTAQCEGQVLSGMVKAQWASGLNGGHCSYEVRLFEAMSNEVPFKQMNEKMRLVSHLIAWHLKFRT